MNCKNCNILIGEFDKFHLIDEKERWKPKTREYYCIVDLGLADKIEDRIWTNDRWDNRNWERFNCFKTREEALEEADVIIALLGMRAGMKSFDNK